MKISTRNVLSGTVRTMAQGPVSTEVTISISPGVEIVAVISTVSAERLGLAPGKAGYAPIKASSVMVGGD